MTPEERRNRIIEAHDRVTGEEAYEAYRDVMPVEQARWGDLAESTRIRWTAVGRFVRERIHEAMPSGQRD